MQSDIGEYNMRCPSTLMGENRGRFHEKSQTEPGSRLSQGLKSETFVSAEFLAQTDFTKGGLAETSLKLWSQLFNLISYLVGLFLV